MNVSADAQAVEAVVRRYYAALEAGTPLAPFFDLDGPWQPVVKIGTEAGEFDVGRAAVAAVLARVGRELWGNHLESRRLSVQVAGDTAWFADEVWWGRHGPRRAVCRLHPLEWRAPPPGSAVAVCPAARVRAGRMTGPHRAPSPGCLRQTPPLYHGGEGPGGEARTSPIPIAPGRKGTVVRWERQRCILTARPSWCWISARNTAA